MIVAVVPEALAKLSRNVAAPPTESCCAIGVFAATAMLLPSG